MAQRQYAFDTVRFIALLGILINHTMNETSAQPLVNILQDYHAVLFVLLMGVFIDLKGSLSKTLIRSSVLIGTGFALGSSVIVIDIILVQLGFLNLIAWSIARKITKIQNLILITLLWLVFSPIISQFIREFLEQRLRVIPTQKNIGMNLLLEDPISFFLRPFFYSSYPVLQWVSIILFGIVLRHFMKAKWWKISIGGFTMFSFAKTMSLLLGGDLWAMDNGTANDWSHLFDSGAYTGTSLGMLSSVGIGYLIIGLVMFFDKLLKWRVNPYLSGSTLSLYSIHVFSFTMVPMYILKSTTFSFIFFASTLIGFVIISYLWFCLSKFYNFTKYGPLEEFTYYLTLSKKEKSVE